jgi:peptidoglycan-associated lipoprotein
MAVAMAALLALSGCAGSQKKGTTAGTGMEGAEGAGTGLAEGQMGSEEIQPIQPKEMTSIGFDYDRFDLSPEARSVLADNAAWMENNAGVNVQIQGHCDERGSNEYNLALGDRRAKSAYNYLVNLGISPSRLSTISYGEELPLCRAASEQCWGQNRRAQFVVK